MAGGKGVSHRRKNKLLMSESGSCVTSIAGPNGVAQLHER
jgi:hypothetical protein